MSGRLLSFYVLLGLHETIMEFEWHSLENKRSETTNVISVHMRLCRNPSFLVCSLCHAAISPEANPVHTLSIRLRYTIL
jgi:hypothetical protein